MLNLKSSQKQSYKLLKCHFLVKVTVRWYTFKKTNWVTGDIDTIQTSFEADDDESDSRHQIGSEYIELNMAFNQCEDLILTHAKYVLFPVTVCYKIISCVCSMTQQMGKLRVVTAEAESAVAGTVARKC